MQCFNAAILLFTALATSGMAGTGDAQPSDATKSYYVERTEARYAEQYGDKDVTELGKSIRRHLNREIAPLEGLLFLEILEPLRADVSKQVDGKPIHVKTSVVIQYPRSYRRYREARKQFLDGGKALPDCAYIAQELPIAEPRAIVIVTAVRTDAGEKTVKTVHRTVSFRDQSDSDGDGKWDHRSCWTSTEDEKALHHVP